MIIVNFNQEKLARLLDELKAAVKKTVDGINAGTKNEPFYGKIQLIDGKRFVGLFSGLRMDKDKILFLLTEERITIEGKVVSKTMPGKAGFDTIQSVEAVKTVSGRPVFIEEQGGNNELNSKSGIANQKAC